MTGTQYIWVAIVGFASLWALLMFVLLYLVQNRQRDASIARRVLQISLPASRRLSMMRSCSR
jgi:hypothetical protein